MRELNAWLRVQPGDRLKAIRAEAEVAGDEETVLALTPWPGCDCHKAALPTPFRIYCICPSYMKAKLDRETGARLAKVSDGHSTRKGGA